MDNPMDIFSTLMSNPDAIENIKNIMTSMSSQKEEPEPEPPHIEQTETQNQIPDMSFLTKILSSNDKNLQIMNKVKEAYDLYNNPKDPGINLLNALTPYLSQSRKTNLEKMKNIIKISKASTAFTKK